MGKRGTDEWAFFIRCVDDFIKRDVGGGNTKRDLHGGFGLEKVSRLLPDGTCHRLPTKMRFR
jgi:hypothetical protein